MPLAEFPLCFQGPLSPDHQLHVFAANVPAFQLRQHPDGFLTVVHRPLCPEDFCDDINDSRLVQGGEAHLSQRIFADCVLVNGGSGTSGGSVDGVDGGSVGEGGLISGGGPSKVEGYEVVGVGGSSESGGGVGVVVGGSSMEEAPSVCMHHMYNSVLVDEGRMYRTFCRDYLKASAVIGRGQGAAHVICFVTPDRIYETGGGYRTRANISYGIKKQCCPRVKNSI